ncbi:MAG: tRNA epoxyqueuosine(34) reductase QueG [Pseudomonadota bacterium]
MDKTIPAAMNTLRRQIEQWSRSLGFAAVGISDIALADAQRHLDTWLERGFHGEMHWMSRHGRKRSQPDLLVPGTVRVISVRMDYWPEATHHARTLLDDESRAYVSRYALGRDYHKLMRNRLQQLADRISEQASDHGYRAFVDSAPVLEKPLAQKAGLGWIGKHTNLINSQSGSYFFLGELFTNLPLPVDTPAEDHCGSCRACIDVCPTQAIVAPYLLDARRCISYQTIENDGDIPEPLRKPIGNRIYGCDDCQLFCPWNKFAQQASEPDFAPRQSLDDVTLVALSEWQETDFLQRLQGSAIRRIGFRRWQRNLAVGLGNAATSRPVMAALDRLAASPSEQVASHAAWGLEQHGEHIR